MSLFERVRTGAKRLRHRGTARHCTVCESDLDGFRPFGLRPRPEAQCPVCRALERHRLLILFLRRHTDLFDGRPKRMLYVAPEGCFLQLFRGTAGLDLLTADLESSRADVHFDVQAIPYEDGRFDVVYCNHVLEHVPDDRLAMRELRRVLSPGGWAVLNVPLFDGPTIEDPSVTDPAERERLFGQSDHVRKYGSDYPDRLREAGFEVSTHVAPELVDPGEFQRLGIVEGETIFHCRPGAAG